MSKYKEKACIICGNNFVPTSGKQLVCFSQECRVIHRRASETRRRKAKAPKYTRNCLVCGDEFTTTDSKRRYCGKQACETKRCQIKARRAEDNRKGNPEALYRRHLQYRKKNPEIKLPIPFEKILNDFYVEDYTLVSTSYVNNKSKLKCVCPKGHIWEVSYHSFKDGKARCPRCICGSSSKAELEILDFVESLNVGKVISQDRQLIKPYELDIYVPSHNVAIEYCGLYWHSEVGGGKAHDYHYKKMMSCAEQGVRLITVFEDEYLEKPQAVLGRIRNALSAPLRRVYARKTVFKEVPREEADKFLSENHLQGASSSKYAFGLYLEDELLMVMTFGALSRAHAAVDGKPTLELKRFASISGLSVPGGASKLLKHSLEFIREGGSYEYLKSYCDMRYANIRKPVYETLGFELVNRTKFTPHYVKGQARFRNQGLRKTPEERLTGKTEIELRREQGYDRIYDCGHRSYIMKL